MAAMRFTRPTVEVPAEASGWRSGASTNTLDDVMRGPSINTPDVVVLDAVPDDIQPRQEFLDPKEDLWLSTADGRYNAPIIPLRVGEGPNMQTFYVHKNILLKAEFFRKALCGQFKEKESQSIDLPEEDPAIFHFIIAFLYEDRYVPIKPVATALLPDTENGKAQDMGHDGADSDSDSDSEINLFSDSSARSRRHRDRRRRREDRRQERLRQKHPGVHRPHCNCPQCLSAGGPPCWHCSAPRLPPMPPPPPPPPFPGADYHYNNHHHYNHHQPNRRRSRRRPRQAAAAPPPPPPPPPLGPTPPPAAPAFFRIGSPTNATAGGLPLPPLPPPPPPAGTAGMTDDRITGEDLRTWLLAYELDLDVYICANKFLLADFKREVARHAVDMLETAGGDAAQPEVLALCTKLYAGLSEADPLLKMIFARLGFLQPALWARDPAGTASFLVANPEVAAVILRETAARRHDDFGGRALPPLERSWVPPPLMPVTYPLDVGYYPRPRPVRF